MSHILVCSAASPGHVDPLLTAARHLQSVGHNVTFNTSECFRRKVESAGIRFIPAVGKANYDYRKGLDSQAEKNLSSNEHKTRGVRAWFAETIPDQHRLVQQILQETPVDVVVAGTMFFGVLPMLLGPRSKRPPVVGLGVNPLMLSSRDCALTSPPEKSAEGKRRILKENQEFQATFQPLSDCMNEMLHACGAPSTPHFFLDSMYLLPNLVLQFTADVFEFPRSDMPDTIRFAGPLPPKHFAGFEKPDWWAELDGRRPVVLVTQGTLANRDLNEVIQPALTGLADEEVTVIVAAGTDNTQTLAVPANARVASFIPFDQLLPKVDVFVTNGGYGAVNQALSLGVPTVVAGETEDKNFVAARVAWSGAGISLKTRYASPEQIRSAVREILTTKRYRAEAQRLQANFAQYNALDEVARAVDTMLAQDRVMEKAVSA